MKTARKRLRRNQIAAGILCLGLNLLPGSGAWAQSAYNVFNPSPDLTKTADGQWLVNDTTRPLPKTVSPKSEEELKELAKAPSDAKELLKGDTLSQWKVPSFWVLKDGILEITPGPQYLETIETFGSCRVHLEWMAPAVSDRKGQDRGNSGVYLMSQYEIQVLDTYDNVTYADGVAGALYGAKPPDANALRPSGQWQYYDIWFRRPTFDASGAMATPACVTVYINGILAQNNVPFEGPSSHKKRNLWQAHPDKMPFRLQYHNESVKFRNVWILPLEDDKVLPPSGAVGIAK